MKLINIMPKVKKGNTSILSLLLKVFVMINDFILNPLVSTDILLFFIDGTRNKFICISKLSDALTMQ